MNTLFSLGQPWEALVIAGAVITALVAIIKLPGIIWEHVLQPIAKSVVEVGTISDLSKVAPAIIDLSHVAPALIQLSRMASVLDEIAQQFKTDSGSSLRDIVNRLEAAAELNASELDRLQQERQAPIVLATAKVEAGDLRAAATKAAADLMAVATQAAAQLKALAVTETRTDA